VLTEIGSGRNDPRKQRLSLIQDRSIRLIVVEHKERSARFGFHSCRTLLQNDGRDNEVCEAENGKKDLLQNMARSSRPSVKSGQGRRKRKTLGGIPELAGGQKRDGAHPANRANGQSVDFSSLET
jgi:predicted site-specific integrase-resolvase